MDQGQGALTQLRAYLAQCDLPSNSRLPPERELCDILGVSRGELRKALAVMESNGELWRHVGKGTFIGTRPTKEYSDVAAIAALTNPRDVMRARLLIEPQIAREAALNATAGDIAELRQCMLASRQAETWRQYENRDNRLHRAIAEATNNPFIPEFLDLVVERTRSRAFMAGHGADEAMHLNQTAILLDEHRSIVEAISRKDPEKAREAMRAHLEQSESRIRLSASNSL